MKLINGEEKGIEKKMKKMVHIWTNIKWPYEWDGIKYNIHFKNHISGFLIFISLATLLATYTIVWLMCTLPSCAHTAHNI